SSVPNRFGKSNGAFHFDGLTSYISVPDKPTLRLNNTDFTLNAWIKLDVYSTSYVSTIISKRFSGLNNGWLWAINGPLNTPNGAIYYGPGGGNADAIGNVVLSTGQWYMVTCTYTVANSQLNIYVNGVLDQTINNILSANASTAATLYIGKDDAVPGGNNYFFQGSMDELRIYNRAINANEMQKLYMATQ
ncbi:MAG: hypothetical protein JWQ57_711, partial [Mucilaginibacter sp.]|nr:hypothetical protein [Mucilaginibacter sp.]